MKQTPWARQFVRGTQVLVNRVGVSLKDSVVTYLGDLCTFLKYL